MSPQIPIGVDVLEAALDRFVRLYEDGHRVVVSISGGKDSTATLEVARLAARATGRLPVEAVMRDDEIMLPGTFEYLERLAADPEISLTWLVSGCPVFNAYDREVPYYWPFDERVAPDEWIRIPPAIAQRTPQPYLMQMVNLNRYPPAPGKILVDAVGVRAAESIRRLGAVQQTGSWITARPRETGAYFAKPLYDWRDGDVWRFIRLIGADYNRAYDVLAAAGIPLRNQRIAPPPFAPAGLYTLPTMRAAWPRWWARVAARLPSLERAACFGRTAITPDHRAGEEWRLTFMRECVRDSPGWIRERAELALYRVALRHQAHGGGDIPDNEPCPACQAAGRRHPGSWRELALRTYDGDPEGRRTSLSPAGPEAFRPSGLWANWRNT